MKRTRIKICGITRECDLDSAVAAGVDAIGFVFYPQSPRYVSPERAAQLARRAPPFVTRVGLFVNAAEKEVRETMAKASLELLQFHGDEAPSFCDRFDRPWIKAARVRPGLDLLEFATAIKGPFLSDDGITRSGAAGLLLDAYVDGYGGGGACFDWLLIPSSLPLPVILSGGLTVENVGAAVRAVRPWAVDVSSGVEEDADEPGKTRKGIKDFRKIAEFVAGVRNADAQNE